MIRGSFTNNLRPICECCQLFVKADVSQKTIGSSSWGQQTEKKEDGGGLALSSADFK